jgi:hypothetical protein
LCENVHDDVVGDGEISWPRLVLRLLVGVTEQFQLPVEGSLTIQHDSKNDKAGKRSKGKGTNPGRHDEAVAFVWNTPELKRGFDLANRCATSDTEVLLERHLVERDISRQVQLADESANILDEIFCGGGVHEQEASC